MADDPLIPPTGDDPPLRLWYSNADDSSPQARKMRGQTSFSFQVPPGKYSRMLVFLTSSEGSSDMTFELNYDSGPAGMRDVVLPEWYFLSLEPGTGHVARHRNTPIWVMTRSTTSRPTSPTEKPTSTAKMTAAWSDCRRSSARTRAALLRGAALHEEKELYSVRVGALRCVR